MTIVEKETVGGYAREIIRTQPGLTNQQILDLVRIKFPTNRTQIASIAWYKSDLKRLEKAGKLQPLAAKDRTVDAVREELAAAKIRVTELEAELGGLEEMTKKEKVAQMIELLLGQGMELPEAVVALARQYDVPVPGDSDEGPGGEPAAEGEQPAAAEPEEQKTE